MNGENINKSSASPRVLIAPLDWGLGHATRCIPIISSLLKNNADVILAANGRVEVLLQNEFPQLKIIPLSGYRVSYSRRKSFFNLKLIIQLPRIFRSIRNENRWLKAIIKKEKIDIVISDNRPGLYSADTHCIYITHQLAIQSGNKLIEQLLQSIHYRYINRFNECWVPDVKNAPGLAGKLSHPVTMPVTQVKYTGILSRFSKKPKEIKYDLLFILSGPEPQRTVLEKLIFSQIKGTRYTYKIVRGLPISTEGNDPINDHIINHADAELLNDLITQSEIVIARCGYSTVMDLIKTDQNAILIPTPGQTEQEYLAEHLSEQNLFYCIPQKNFSLERSIQEARNLQYSRSHISSAFNEDIVTEMIGKFSFRQL